MASLLWCRMAWILPYSLLNSLEPFIDLLCYVNFCYMNYFLLESGI